MKTYLTLWYSSEGDSPIEVGKKLNALGFVDQQGNYDFSYSWDKRPPVDELLRLGNLIQKKLHGSKAVFKMETI
ncbi:MAG: hypothetical protein KAW41_06645 [Candidatus Diapherotrites archaeon]|nr:hypothetical protein [Candidatus Diapherotrites archaeon]